MAVGKEPYLRRTEFDLLTDGVDDDEIVAQPVHLGKTDLHSLTIAT